MKLRYKIINSVLLFLVVSLLGLALTISYTADCQPTSPAAASSNSSDKVMHAIQRRCYGSPDVLEYATVAMPEIGADEALVKVEAAAVNPLDWHYMRASPYFMRLGTGIGSPDDARLGVDFSGTVAAIGADVTQFEVGDAVFGGADGAFAEYVRLDASKNLVRKPANISFAQAAGVPIAGLTALQALRDQGHLKAGQRVLINGASGGVGTFAVQIAKSMGAHVSGVCSTRNVALVKSLGADQVFDYKKDNFIESGQKFDLIVDNVSNHALLDLKKVLTPNGRVVIVGGPSGDWFGPLVAPVKAMLMSPFVDQHFGMFVASFSIQDLTTLADLMQQGKVTTVIDQRFALKDTADAIRYSESGRARGKIIIEVN